MGGIMKRLIFLTVFICLMLPAFSSFAQDGYAEITSENITLKWKVDGKNLHVVVSAPTTGWISVGFDPTARMKDSNIIIGYVQNGVTELRFTIPLDSGDRYDRVLAAGKTYKVNLAYGRQGQDNFNAYHGARTQVEITL